MSKAFLLILLFVSAACNESGLKNAGNTKFDSSFSNQIDHDFLGKDFARKQLQEALNGGGQRFTWDTIIKDSSTAVAIAEPILFETFGKEHILGQKPYEVYFIDNYWYLSGTIPIGSKGGGFEIILSSIDAQIIRLTHYK